MAKSVVIIGASSGIGEALASGFAAKGYDIGLAARRKDKLENIASQLKAKYKVSVAVASLDMQDENTMLPALQLFNQELGNIDILIANAGITGIRRTGRDDVALDKAILQTNLVGNITLFDETAKIMLKQGFGHIVGMSSFSAFSPIPGSAAYCASKSGLTAYMNAMRLELMSKKIDVSVIHPGFIRTELAANLDKYPFVIGVEDASKQIIKAIEAKKSNVIVPALPWKIIRTVLQLTPDSVMTLMVKKFMNKK